MRYHYKHLIVMFMLALAFLPGRLMATHQRAAEITFRHVKDLEYEITLISYTFTPSPANAYRDYLTINWGDGKVSDIQRKVITYLPDDITYNKYVGTHEFPGAATFTISCEDPNRNGGIINIPNSINTPLYIYSELTISPFIQGFDNSPVLLIPPVDNGCVNQVFYHNPGAYDPDGDSLSYRLVPCRGVQGQQIPGYTYPAPPPELTLNPVTGDLIWDYPTQQGEFNIAILIEEWRNGARIGSVLRDMQITIVACDNKPPVIDPIPDTCVEAGKTLRFPVTAHDTIISKITLTATGGPFTLATQPATLTPEIATGYGSVEAIFKWSTACEHIRLSPYQVLFKAKDDGRPVSLVNIKSMMIRVVGPAPDSLAALPVGNSIALSWDTLSCRNAAGYYVYRKADSTGFVHGYCETGVPAWLGYTRIATLQGVGTTSYLDDNGGAGLQRGLRYCYIVVAWFHDKAEGYASAEVCATLKKDVPVITNASITATGAANGSVYVAWSRPTELDTVQIPGPYRYLILRSRSDAPDNLQAVDSLDNLNDTIFNNLNLNTSQFHYRYRIDLWNVTPGNRFLVGSSQPANTVFLSAYATDKMNKLTWTNNVPWLNKRFTVYRKDPGGSTYDSIAGVTQPRYNDRGLVNGLEYCYRIRSTGNYSAPGFVDPILNDSQELCAVPVDNVPPCPPLLTVATICESSTNRLSWRIPSDTCPTDIQRYYIYYTQLRGTPVLIDSLTGAGDTVYLHIPPGAITGCYAVAAADSLGNRSEPGNVVCIDYTNCPEYTLPNLITPNGDFINDTLTPFPGYTSIRSVMMKIYDRWGRMVYKTTEPPIRWDGRDMTTGNPCSDGTYFYVCDVTAITLDGDKTFTLKGTVTILR